MRLRVLLLVVVLVVVAGVGFLFWRGSSSFPLLEGCQTNLGSTSVDLSTEQAENASLIAAIGVRRGLPPRAVSIALATAYQESKIRNLPGGDRDSAGLFQQRPSQGWGTRAQVQNPYHSINAFYDALAKVPDYGSLPITVAAQRVQRSGYPSAYAQHEPEARALASVLTGYSQGGRFSCVVARGSQTQAGDEVIQLLREAYGPLAARRTGSRQDVAITVTPDEAGVREGWSVAQFVVAHAGRLEPVSVQYDGRLWRSGTPSRDGWVPHGSPDARQVIVSMG